MVEYKQKDSIQHISLKCDCLTNHIAIWRSQAFGILDPQNQRCPKLGKRWLSSLLMPVYKSCLVRFKNLVTNLIKESIIGWMFPMVSYLLGTSWLLFWLLPLSLSLLIFHHHLSSHPCTLFRLCLKGIVGGVTHLSWWAYISIWYGWGMGVAAGEGVLQLTIAQLPFSRFCWEGVVWVYSLSLTHPPPIENYCSRHEAIDGGGWERLRTLALAHLLLSLSRCIWVHSSVADWRGPCGSTAWFWKTALTSAWAHSHSPLVVVSAGTLIPSIPGLYSHHDKSRKYRGLIHRSEHSFQPGNTWPTNCKCIH